MSKSNLGATTKVSVDETFSHAAEALKGKRQAEAVFGRVEPGTIKSDERRVPKDRRCTGCGGVKPAVSQWNLRLGVCRSCASKVKGDKAVVETVLEDDELIHGVVTMVELRGLRVRRLRELAGMSQRYMACLCGWSVAYQRKIESGNLASVGVDKVVKLYGVLKEYGIRLKGDGRLVFNVEIVCHFVDA